jgi:hypothetical protein
MKRISILVDKKMAAYLELPKNMGVSVASGRNDALRRFKRLRCDNDISIIMVSRRVLDWIDQLLSMCTEQGGCPFVASLVNKGGPRTQARHVSRLLGKIVEPS